MARDRARFASCCLALAVLGCGARTDLDVPPPAPPPAPPPECMLDDAIPAIPPCEAFELGGAVLLSESVRPGGLGAHVDEHAASPHLGGAAVSYAIALSADHPPEVDFQVRVVVLDAEARAQRGPEILLAEHVGAMGPSGYATSAAAPSVSGGCEAHALGHLKIFDPASETARLAIAGDEGLELVELEGYVWDLRREGEVLSWLELRLDGGGLQEVFADRRGGLLRRVPLEPFGRIVVGVVSRHALGDGTFVMPVEHEGPSEPLSELAHYDESGAVFASHSLAPAWVDHTALAWRRSERWLFWSERTDPDRFGGPRSLHAARLGDDGALGPALAFELAGLDAVSRFTPAWIGDHWLVPVLDRETDTSYLGVFDEAGRRQALLPLGGGVAHPSDHSRTAHVVPTPAGAIVTYDAARVGDGGAIPFRVLEARTVRCVAR